MWNPLASLPPSNAGALAGYAPAATSTGTQANPGFPAGPPNSTTGANGMPQQTRPGWEQMWGQRLAGRILDRHPGATMFPGLFDDPNFSSNLRDLRHMRGNEMRDWQDQYQTSINDWQQALHDYIAGGSVGTRPQAPQPGSFQSPLFTYLTTGQMPQSQSGF